MLRGALEPNADLKFGDLPHAGLLPRAPTTSPAQCARALCFRQAARVGHCTDYESVLFLTKSVYYAKLNAIACVVSSVKFAEPNAIDYVAELNAVDYFAKDAPLYERRLALLYSNAGIDTGWLPNSYSWTRVAT